MRDKKREILVGLLGLALLLSACGQGGGAAASAPGALPPVEGGSQLPGRALPDRDVGDPPHRGC